MRTPQPEYICALYLERKHDSRVTRDVLIVASRVIESVHLFRLHRERERERERGRERETRRNLAALPHHREITITIGMA